MNHYHDPEESHYIRAYCFKCNTEFNHKLPMIPCEIQYHEIEIGPVNCPKCGYDTSKLEEKSYV